MFKEINRKGGVASRTETVRHTEWLLCSSSLAWASVHFPQEHSNYFSK